MMSGKRTIWITLEVKSQMTKAGAGSKRKGVGANVFHKSQPKVQKESRKKKPIVPTARVVCRANFSSEEKAVLASSWTCLTGCR